MKWLLVPIALSLPIHISHAHMSRGLLNTYKKAKKYYATGNYPQAQALLKNLIIVQEETDVTPYAYFYYALTAYHQADIELAEDTFTKITKIFPTWREIPEVCYWLAQLRFEQADYKGGLAHLKKLTGKAAQKAAEPMKVYFLEQIDSPAVLQDLYHHYPYDYALGRVLLARLLDEPFIMRNQALINTLVENLGLPVPEEIQASSLTSVKKSTYNVAILLPFFIHEVAYEEEAKNRFVIDMYQGIQMAVGDLDQRGISVKLFAYDTKKSASTTAQLLAQPEMQSMDLIIGPLYAPTIQLVTDFAREHQIYVFNPLSTNAQVVGNNPFVYLLQPSLQTQAKKAAACTQMTPTDGSAVRVGIVYGTCAADSIRAHIYKQYIEQDPDKEVTLMLSLTPQGAQQFLHAFRPVQDTEPYALEKPCLDSLTHIYIASHDKLVIANVLSAVEIMNVSPYIIGDEAWLKEEFLTLDQLQRLPIRFIAPNYIDYEKEALHTFRNLFYDRIGYYPTHYAYVGYDMMLFLGTMLHTYGVHFPNYWQEIFTPGRIFSGFAYGEQHDNQHVPLVKFQDAALVACDRMEP